MTTELKALRELSLDRHFEHEEHDFTPWLEENYDLLEDEGLLGFELENVRREISVGGYRADLVGTDAYDGRTVIIENQFGRTDHDHLGKCLVYAAGTNADVIVWIAEEFEPEHIDAVQMFNRRTENEVAFFAFQASLKQVGDSPPYAIDFTAIAKPDTWLSPENDEELTETERSQLKFWEQFRTTLREQGLGQFATRAAKPTGSYHIRIGLSDAYIINTANYREEALYSRVRVTDPDGNFAGLAEDEVRNHIRELAGEESYPEATPDAADRMQWTPNPEGKYDTMRIDYGAAEFSNEENWPEYHQWLADMSQIYKEVLTDRLK